MADYHFMYKDVKGANTEWDDIQHKVGNLPKKPEPFKLPPFAPRVDANEQPRSEEWLDARDPDELKELKDNDHFLEQYRRMRLAELKEAAKRPDSELVRLLCFLDGARVPPRLHRQGRSTLQPKVVQRRNQCGSTPRSPSSLTLPRTRVQPLPCCSSASCESN